jgi:hypothetical protein
LLGDSRVDVRLDVPDDAGGTRSIIIVEHGGSGSFQIGKELHAFFTEPWLADMRRAAGKVGVTINDPVRIVVERIEQDEVWCVVEGDAISAGYDAGAVDHRARAEPVVSDRAGQWPLNGST